MNQIKIPSSQQHKLRKVQKERGKQQKTTATMTPLTHTPRNFGNTIGVRNQSPEENHISCWDGIVKCQGCVILETSYIMRN